MQLPNGSEPEYQTSLMSIQQHAWAFSLPVDVLRSKLKNQGIDSNPHDRFPFRVIADALLREGWEPQPLTRLR